MYAFRQALVGKRFLCVREKNSLRPNSRSSRVSNPLDYQWKVGVIRACSDKDFHHPELKVLVEYDNEDWTTREWLTIYDGSWKIFLVEKTMVWSQRPDPSNPRRPLLWPALTFFPVVDKHGLSDEDRPIPVEFVGNHERMFVRSDEFRPYGQDDDALQPILRNNHIVMDELRNWQRLQKSQSILLDGPFTLTGFRVKVYRQTCRQWFSAVITAHDLMSRELSCMDDTVLQTHRVDPRLTQVVLLANETELDSLLRGELVRVLPMRQHRHSQVVITAPLATQTTTSSLSSIAPTTLELYAGLTQATNSNNLVTCTQGAYSSPAYSSPACSPPNSQGTSTNKERRKSSETRNRSSASRRVTRSDSANSSTSSSDIHQQTPQTVQPSLTTSLATPLPSSLKNVSRSSSHLSNKPSPPETCTLSPKNSSSSSSMGSPSSSLPKKSPIKQPVSPNTSPTRLQYSSTPVSNSGMSNMGSPFRSNPFHSSPDMSSVVSMASPMSGMSHIGMCSPAHMGYSHAQSPHPLYSHGMGRLNISPSQLYALQLQQQQQQMQSPEQQEFLSKLQHQHYQSLLHQYEMHHYQLQLMLQQQELIKQMPLTLEQQHILAEHYNQLLYQYQCAQIIQQLAAVTQEEQLSSMFHCTDDRTQVLPERIQQQLREAQERQKQELQNLMPRLAPEQLQTFFTCLQQQSMTSDQIKQLYTLLIQQQEAQRRPPQEDEQQKLKIQEYLRQNQEQVQKILQLQQSPSPSQDVEQKREPKKEASSSSPQQETPSSSPFPPSSSASSFTVHYLPTLSDSGVSSDANSKDKPESDLCAGKSTLEATRHKARPNADEIELTSTTTREERSGSPHAILEKLLQHHLQAVEESKQQGSAKTRRARASSTEKKSKRQRKSAESSTRVQDKKNNASEQDSQRVQTSALDPDSSTKAPVSCSITGSASRVQEPMDMSVNQIFSEKSKDYVVGKHKLPTNLVFVDSHPSEAENQHKAEKDQNIASLVPKQRYPLVREDSPWKTTAKVPTRDVVNKGAPLDGFVVKGSGETQNQRPSVITNQSESMDISKSSVQVLEKEKATSFVQKHSERVPVKSIMEEPKPSELKRILLEKKSSMLPEKAGTKGSDNVSAKGVIAKELKSSMLEKTSLMSTENEETKGSENVSSEGIKREKPQNNFLEKKPLLSPEKEGINGCENVSAKGIVPEEPNESLLEKTSLTVPAKEGSKTSNSKYIEKEKEWLELTTLRGMKKSSARLTVKELSKPLSLSKSNVYEAAKMPANVSKQSNHAQDVTSNAMKVSSPEVSQKPLLIPDAQKITANCFSVFSSNSADHNGDLFAEKELKTYSKRITPSKRKSSSKEDIVEENSVLSKVLKMDNMESPEVDPKKMTVQNNANKLSKKLLEQKPLKTQQQDLVSTGVKGKMSRKKSTGENKLPAKKSKCEENNCNNVSAGRIHNKSHLELREKEGNVVDSVSFVADQAVDDVTINHSPTVKDAPGDQFDDSKPNIESLNDKSKERIREMSSKKKKLKAKEQKRKERKNESTVVKKQPADGESLETVVDSVLDEEIAVIYNGEEHQQNHDVNHCEIKKEDVTNEGATETAEMPTSVKKGRKKRESATKELGRGKRKRVKKRRESDGGAVSPNAEQFFLQDKVCAKFSHLPKCRECRDINVDKKTGLEFCRFNMFRRLKKRKNGKALAAGFQLPEHAAPEDLSPWMAQDQVDLMDKNTSLYILRNIGDQFCSVMQEEKKAITQAGENMSVAYKRAVQGVREMCDVCATTIFNMHWVCHRCGFGVCLDCYNLRVKERKEQPGLAGKRVFEFKWFMCCPGICHQPKYLSVAQIIPKTVLSDLGDELHRARDVWKIGKMCPCKTFLSNESDESGAKITEISNEVTDKTDGKEQRNGPNSGCVGSKEEAVKSEAGTAPVASDLARSEQSTSDPVNQNLAAMDSESGFDDMDDVNLICDESLGIDSPTNHEQEWLTEEKRRNHFTKKAGFGLVEAKPRQDKGVSSGLSLLMGYSSSTEGSPCESPAKNDVKSKAGAFSFSFPSGLDLLVLACEGKEVLPVPNNITLDHGTNKKAVKSKPESQNKRKDEEIRNVSVPVATPSECTSAERSDEVRQATPAVSDSTGVNPPTDAPHSWLCDGRLLRLHDPRSPRNVKAFEKRWKKGEPVLVSHVDNYMNLDIWSPESFGSEFGDEIADVVNCRNGVVIEKFKVGDFWKGFESIKDRPLDNNGEPMLLKLKDWPPKDDFSEKLPTRFEDLMNNAPLPEYTRRDGSRNLVSRLPEFFVTPDLGPKMYNAYGSAACPKEGTTNLHLDMSDAVNIMVYVGVPRDQGAGEKEREDAIKAVDEACDESQRKRVRQETARIGALWHIYAAEDADKIRDCLREVAKERRTKHPSHHDPIHDQCFYLDHDIRQRLKEDYGVEGWAICQCLGDAVFIPAGAPHQVRNLYSCVKVAEDFVSPERIDHCFQMTQEFRHLSDKHTNHEDKLQVKNIIYHAVKDALNSLKHYEQELNPTKQHNEKDRVE